jgi:hypothetical protein
VPGSFVQQCQEVLFSSARKFCSAVPGSFAQVGGEVWGFEGARVVNLRISQILPFHMILAKLSKIKLLLLIGLKFLSSLSEKLFLFSFLIIYIYIAKMERKGHIETKTCTEV